MLPFFSFNKQQACMLSVPDGNFLAGNALPVLHGAARTSCKYTRIEKRRNLLDCLFVFYLKSVADRVLCKMPILRAQCGKLRLKLFCECKPIHHQPIVLLAHVDRREPFSFYLQSSIPRKLAIVAKHPITSSSMRRDGGAVNGWP